MYQVDWKVNFSECDDTLRMRYGGIIDSFQNCSNLQSESLGLGEGYLEKHHSAWLMDFWQVVIQRRPEAYEDIRVSTWASSFKGFFGTRNFKMETKQGEVLAYANSYWVFYDLEAKRPVRVPENEISGYGMEKPLDMEYAPRKIAVPEELELVDEITVQKHHLDIYHHMNNAKYIETAYDYVDNTEIRQICCQYKKQARLSDRIKIFRNVSEKCVTIVMKNAENDIYAIVSFDNKE